MAFTRKHFNAIAGMIANRKDAAGPLADRECAFVHSGIDSVVEGLADIFAEDAPIFDNNGNRRFDRERFIRACNGKG